MGNAAAIVSETEKREVTTTKVAADNERTLAKNKFPLASRELFSYH